MCVSFNDSEEGDKFYEHSVEFQISANKEFVSECFKKKNLCIINKTFSRKVLLACLLVKIFV